MHRSWTSKVLEAGFDTAGANVAGTATFTPSRLVPPILRPKLDWLALRGLKPVTGSAAVVPARMSLFSPRFSDHDFIMCIVETQADRESNPALPSGRHY